MSLEQSAILELGPGDEIIVFPGTVHEILPEDTQFLMRVHSIDCHGDADKYVERNGNWCQVLTLKMLDQ